MKKTDCGKLLDVDAYFAKGTLLTKPDDITAEIDCISEETLLPIYESTYAHVYKDFADVGFKRYDAVLLAERPPEDFDRMVTLTENFSDKVITFARTNSELQEHIDKIADSFDKVDRFKTKTGNWYFLTRHKPPEDFCIYVVTHKAVELDGLPKGYKIIHAGRALGEDLGYLGDNTGDNISRLNPYVNELTALYWMWKNTTHSIIGLNHYRRFFTESSNTDFAYEKILTKDAALKILERYDIIALHIGPLNLTTSIANNVRSTENAKTAVTIIEKYLLRTHPDYLDAFNHVFNGSTTCYNKNMFVTRRDIFDAYCKWLFSFFIDATEEVLRTISMQDASFTNKRLMGFFAEHMHTVWLIKTRLRIKDLKITVKK